METRNWVDDTGGLPEFIQEIVKALKRDGHDESSAIAIAVSRCKVWAAKGNAKAVAALAEWEAKKAKAHAERGSNMDFEFRGGKVESYDKDKHQIAARAITYNLLDDHGTEFAPGCFSDSLKGTRGVKSVWSHDATRPIGKIVDYRDTNDGLDVIIQLADIEAVQDARMVHALLKDEIIGEFSVGFIRKSDENDGERITKAELVEISPVLRGSNPGTRTLAVRSATRAEATELLNQVALGEITADDALAQLTEARDTVTIPAAEYRSLMDKAGIVTPESLSLTNLDDFMGEVRSIDDLMNEDW